MKAATLAVGSMIAVMFMGSTIVTPLYSLYAKHFGFSAVGPLISGLLVQYGPCAGLLACSSPQWRC